MIRKALLACAVTLLLSGGTVFACMQNPEDKPAYTTQEYNAFGAATNEPAAASRVKLLDDFVAKYPQSTLLCYIHQSYFVAYNELKNHPKVIEHADKMLEFGDKFNATQRYQALYFRTVSFLSSFVERNPGQEDKAHKGRAAAREGLKVLAEVPKPENVTDEQWAQQKKNPTYIFNYTTGIASIYLKDYPAAVEGFHAALAMNPNDGVSLYRLGLVYLQMTPPQSLDGFWSLARAINLKVAGEAQVRAYLRNQMLRYQLTSCEKDLDAQITELLGLAAGSAERPANWKFPSSAELEQVRAKAAGFLDELKLGDERSRNMWLAVCGLEFPDVAVRVMEKTDTETGVVLKVARAGTLEEMQAMTEPNMEISVAEQPEAQRILVEKETFVRFTGTLSGFQPEPFLVRWDKAKVHAEDIPEAKPEPAKKAPPKKAPAKKSPTKRPPA